MDRPASLSGPGIESKFDAFKHRALQNLWDEGFFSPENKHGTWKWGPPGKGDSMRLLLEITLFGFYLECIGSRKRWNLILGKNHPGIPGSPNLRMVNHGTEILCVSAVIVHPFIIL